MRLWHYKFIPYLPRLQLISQHRECCALRGLGWGKKHSTVDYIFKYNYRNLYLYHLSTIDEIIKRNYTVNEKWLWSDFRGSKLNFVIYHEIPNNTQQVLPNYPEHNDEYLKECLINLTTKMQKEPHKYSKEDFERMNTFMKDYNYVK